MTRVIGASAISPFVSQRITFFRSRATDGDLAVLGGLLRAGTVTPVVDRCYPLAEAAEAIRYLDRGHARGKVVVTM